MGVGKAIDDALMQSQASSKNIIRRRRSKTKDAEKKRSQHAEKKRSQQSFSA